MRWFILPLVACMALACTPQSSPPDTAPGPETLPTAVEPVPTSAPEAATPEPSTEEGVAFVNWSVLNETNIAEYRILRGESRDGPWTQIATEEGQGAGLYGQHVYYVEERGLEIGQVLYYLIEQVNIDGTVTPIGPIEYTVLAEDSTP